MSNDKLDLRIGELLIAANILTAKELAEAMKTARTTGLPVGRVLIMAGFVTEQEFQASVQAQSLVRDGIVPLTIAVTTLSQLSETELTFDEALSQSGWVQTEDKESNKLGELLTAADIVPAASLQTAMRTSQATGLPLGRLLVSLGSISDELLATALNAQSLIRSGRVRRAEALEGLRAAHKRRLPVEMTLTEKGYYRSPHRSSIRLGELFFSAGVITEEQVNDSLELALQEQKYFGQILLQRSLIDEAALEAGLTLQEMVANETLSAAEASTVLRKFVEEKRPVSELIAFLIFPASEFKTKVRYHEVLRVAGIIGQKDLEQLEEELQFNNAASTEDAIKIGAILLEKDILDARTYHGSLRCYFLIATGWLNMQQGIIALNYFHHRACEFDQVMRELHWTLKTYLRSELEKRTSATVS